MISVVIPVISVNHLTLFYVSCRFVLEERGVAHASRLDASISPEDDWISSCIIFFLFFFLIFF